MEPDWVVRLEQWSRQDWQDVRDTPTGGQRAVAPQHARLWLTLLAAGRYYPMISTPVALMEDGTWGNGHNRAEAFKTLPAGVLVPVLVARDVPMAALQYVDVHRARTLGQQLRYAFPERSASECDGVAALLRLAITYRGTGQPMVNPYVDPHEATAWAVEHGDALFWAATRAKAICGKEVIRSGTQKQRPEGSVMTDRSLALLLFVLHDDPVARERAVTCFSALAARTTAGDKGDPRTAMTRHFSMKNNALTKGASNREETLVRIAAIFNCWNALVAGGRWRPWKNDAASFPTPFLGPMEG